MEKAKRLPSVRLPARAGIWGIISSLVARGVGVVGTPIFTRLLTPAEYGLYPLYTTWSALIGVVATMGLTGGAIYRGMQRYSDRRESFLSAALGLMLTGFLGLVLLGIIFGRALSAVSGLSLSVIALLLSEVMLSGVIALTAAKHRYLYEYKTLSFINIISAIGTPVISVAFVTLTPYRAEARIFGSLITAFIIATPQLIVLIRSGKRLYDREIWRYLLRVNIPLLPHYAASSLILRVSELVIGRAYGTEPLGKYSVAMSVGLALTVLTNGLGQVFSPWVLRKLSCGRLGVVRELLYRSASGLLLCSLLLLTIAPEVLAVISPPEYHDALPAVYPLALSVGAMFISASIMSAETYYEKSVHSALPTVAVAAVSSAVAILVLPLVDYRFSALFTLASYLSLAVLNAITFKRLAGNSIIDLKRFSLLFSLSIFYAALIFLLRGVLLSRVLLAIPLLPPLFVIARRVWRQVREPHSAK